MTLPDLDVAHMHSMHHRAEIDASRWCGCFYCGAIFDAEEVERWADMTSPQAEWTALCPQCAVDSVIGDASGFPITPKFLAAMRWYWFEGIEEGINA